MMYLLKTNQTLMVLAALLAMGCDEMGDCERGRGPIVSQQLELDDFHGLQLSGSDKLYISQGPSQEVRVEGEQNIIDLLRTDVSGGIWNIRTRGCVGKHEQLVFYVTLPDISALSVSGSGDIIGENLISADAIDFQVTGSGSITAAIQADVDAEVTGSGKLNLKGESESLKIKITGSGECDTYDLQAEVVEVEVQGSGEAYVTALDQLDVSIKGSGNVYYRGSPTINSSITGSGKLIKR